MNLKTVRPDGSDIRFAMDSRLPQRAVVQQVFRMLADDGIFSLLRRLGVFSLQDVLTACESEFGYLMHDAGRSRTVGKMLALLAETGVVSGTDDCFVLDADTALPDTFNDRETAILHAAFSGQITFFTVCADQLPSFLRGEPCPVRFDTGMAPLWKQFLENEEYAYARTLLIGLLMRGYRKPVRLLDLCCGTGAGSEMIHRMWPDAEITAIDANDLGPLSRAFASEGPPLLWRGFGDPLPYDAGTFDVVFFACADPYIPHSLRHHVYADIYRILRSGGSLGILTRGLPDPERRYMRDPWMRRAALGHDILESVCAGWQGFSCPKQSAALFETVGFTTDAVMLDASLWKLVKP